ncbi:S-layer homology domain-containing protein [Niallia oryzisoli]|uniref:S-layer homology domain-containing protein n=1 Tax=Niallia oryzisoli TaxID=1737571 RepID=A0ABZ2CFL6_9BACI
MAYQPKSYRKFIAGAAAAAVVAPVAAPAVFAASFTDVPAQYEEAVSFLTSKGIKGTSDTTFGTYENIKRVDAAVMVARALELDIDNAPASGFTDVPARAEKEVNALKEAGITSGKTATTFDSQALITRGELAIWIQRAYDLKASNDTLAFNDVPSQYATAVSALVNAKVTSGTTATTFGTYDNAKRGDFAQFLLRADKYEPTPEAPAVESVSAINAKQVVVKFNTALEGNSATLTNDATDVANYTLDGVDATSAVLSEDKKSVTVTFAADVEGEDQVLVVNPVATTTKDKNGAVVNTVKYSEILTYTDTDAPTVVSTSYASGVITVQYSEEIGTAPSVVRVNGVPVAAGDIAIASDATKVTINAAGLAAGSTNSLYIAGAKDTANVANEVALFNGTVIVPTSDSGKPQIAGVTVTGQNTAKVTLSEAITSTTIAAKLQKGAEISDVTLTKDLTDTTGKTYLLSVDLNGATAGDGIFAGTSTSETFSLLFAAEALVDSTGNKSAEFITTVTFVKDTKAPALVKSEVLTDKTKVAFSFDEALTVNGSDANIVVKNSDGVKINVVDGETALNGSDSKVYEVDFVTGATAIAAGTYTVTIPAGFFQDTYGNKSAAVTQTFTVGTASSTDTVKPVAQVSNASAANTFSVAYYNGTGALEEVSTSALNAANYNLDGKALPAGTEIYFTSTAKNTVEIVLPEGSVNIGNQTAGANAVLTVSNVQDKAGNTNVTSNHTVVVKDNTAATIQSVQVLGTDVYVTFNEDVVVPATTDALVAFNVTVNGTALTATDVSDLTSVSGNAKQVKFTLTTTPAATPVVTVLGTQTVLKDANGVAVR